MSLVLQVLATAQALEKAGVRLFKTHRLTGAQFNVLNLVGPRPEGLRASELAGLLVVDPSNVTGLLNRMRRDGLLLEKTNPADGRQRIVVASAKGRQLWQRACPLYQRRLEACEGAVSPADRQRAQKILARLLAAAAALP